MALDLKRQTNHGVVGLMVARNWQLPQEVALAVRHHPDPRIEGLPLAVQALIILLQFACHLHAKRTGGVDTEWRAVWKAHAESLFHMAGHGLSGLEAAILNREP